LPDSSGNTRWLPPGSAKPAEPKAAVKLPRGAPAAVHMGNLPVAGLGLSKQRQQDLDALAADPKSAELYVRKLPRQEQAAARAYFKTAGRRGTTVAAVTTCKEAEAYMNSLIRRGADVTAMRRDIAAVCPSVRPTSSADALRASTKKKLSERGKCGEGEFWGSLGYGRGFDCMPYGQGSRGAAPRLHQSDITGTNR
jgi:hypothetical protein